MRLCRPARLPRLLDRYADAPLGYAEVGHTARALPGGYRHLVRKTSLGAGTAAFEAAAQALLSWRMHARAGLAVTAEGPAEPGRTVLVSAGRPLCLVLPCRVVAVEDGADRRGFAYGTLPGHAERGEERFVVQRGRTGRCWLEIRAFSRPVGVAAAAAPVSLLAQKAATRRYERALVAIAREAADGA